MKVIVGLGNPGREYADTRHNIGFTVVEAFARKFGPAQVGNAFESETAELFLSGEKILLVEPQTYMNLSGRSVKAIVQFYKLGLEDLLIVCDDLNLPLGQIRLKPTGSSGGQKGLRDIIHQLGTEAVPRLRCGIGRPPGKMDVSTYVLKKFLQEQQEEVSHSVVAAVDAIEMWIKMGIEQAMCQVNRKPND